MQIFCGGIFCVVSVWTVDLCVPTLALASARMQTMKKKRLRFKSEHSHDDNKQTNIRLIVKSALYISESFFCGSM